jgi:diamine N-acetyltransferase
MTHLSLQEVTRENWRATLDLAVHPEQQRFIADYVPIAAIALAKAYVRPGGLVWMPYAIFADQRLVGFIELAYEPGSSDRYWVYHFFIDRAYQGKGHGKAALQAFVQLIKTQHPDCRQINLTVHPENAQAQHLYLSIGFRATGAIVDDEPVYTLHIADVLHEDHI